MADNLQTATPPAAGGDVIRDQDKIMLVLAYLGILALIPLLAVKDSDYVKFHAKQGIVLCGCVIAAYIVSWILLFIPILGWLLNCLVVPVGSLVLMIFAIVQAFKPNRWKIPLVSQIAEKF